MSKNEGSDKSEPVTCDYLDDELIFKELYLKCQTLTKEKIEKLRIRQDLGSLIEKNEKISKSLLELKREFDMYKSDLCKTLFNLKVSADKQRILSNKKLNDFSKKLLRHQEYYKLSPKQQELDNLLSTNKQLEEEYKTKTDLMLLTKKEYEELRKSTMQTFQKKVCEFCDIALRLKK